jgi:hypothetical protein
MNSIAIIERESLLTELTDLVNHNDLAFAEQNTRMNYGLIGLVSNKKGMVLMIYQGSFYVFDKDFPLNTKTLRMIELIKLLFHDVSRDEKNNLTPYYINKLV